MCYDALTYLCYSVRKCFIEHDVPAVQSGPKVYTRYIVLSHFAVLSLGQVSVPPRSFIPSLSLAYPRPYISPYLFSSVPLPV